MAITVGGVVIKLMCDSASFQKDWDKAGRTLKKTEREWSRMGTSLTRSITRPLAMAGLAALAYQVNWAGAARSIGKSINKHAQDIGKLKGSMGSLKTAGDALGDSFANAIAPALDDVARALIPVIENVAKLSMKFSEQGQGTQRMIVGMALLAAAMGPALKVGALLLKVIRGILSAKFVVPFSAAVSPIAAGAMLALGAAVALIGVFWNDWGKQVDAMPDKIGKVKDYLDKLVASNKNLQLFPRARGGSSDEDVAGFLAPYIAEAKAEAEAFKLSVDELVAYWTWVDEVKSRFGRQEYSGGLGYVGKMFRPSKTGSTDMPRGDNQLVPEMDTDWASDYVAQFEKMTDVVQGWGDAWADTVSRAIVDGRLLALNFGDFFKQIAADIMYMIMKLQLIDPIVKAIMSNFGGRLTETLVTGGGGGGGSGGGGAPDDLSYVTPSYGNQGMSVTIIDNRAMGDQVKVTRKGNTLQVLVEDALGRALAAGRLDPAMATAYGSRRMPVRR